MSYHHHPRSTVHTPVVDKIKRSEEYYLPSGDIIFLVENYLYRVHRYFFERESPYFRQRFSAPAPPGQVPKGTSDSNPFPLEETNAVDFNRFLWVFYNPKFNIYETGANEWVSILKLACTWGFEEVKKFAVRELETKFQEPLDKIRLYHTFEVDKLLLVPSYIAMALRPEPLTLAEGRALGLETALLVARAREFARGTVAYPRGPGEAPVRAPADVALDVKAMEGLIRELFLAAPAQEGNETPTSAQRPSALPHVALAQASPVQHPQHSQSRTSSASHAHVQQPAQPAANLFVPAPAPARDLADIWSSPTTPTVIDSGIATPAQQPEPAKHEPAPAPAIIDPAALAADVRAAEEGKKPVEPETEESDSWFGMGGKKKKAGAANGRNKLGSRV